LGSDLHVTRLKTGMLALGTAPDMDATLAAIFSCMSEGVVFHDADGHIRLCNQSAERILGLTADQIAGRSSLDPLWRTIREDGTPFPGEEHPAMVTLRTGVPLSDVPMGVYKPDESLTWISINTRPLSGTGLEGVLVTFTDVTMRRSIEQRLRHSQKFESLGRLAGGVAHDFNNLLTVMRGYTALLLDQLLPTHPLRQHVASIDVAAEQGANLTRQLLAFSRPQVVRPQRVDLRHAVAHTEPMLRRLVREDIEVLVDTWAAALPVRIDTAQLHQVLVNLAANASDAMPQGGRLRISTRETLSRGEWPSEPPAGAPMAELLVSDTGIGMDASTQQHIFEPFFTTKDAGHGIGLGLSTVHGIVTQAGGTIEVESARGQGTTFRLRLPKLDVQDG
jgi:PAS domain S-box-containing protein